MLLLAECVPVEVLDPFEDDAVEEDICVAAKDRKEHMAEEGDKKNLILTADGWERPGYADVFLD